MINFTASALLNMAKTALEASRGWVDTCKANRLAYRDLTLLDSVVANIEHYQKTSYAIQRDEHVLVDQKALEVTLDICDKLNIRDSKYIAEIQIAITNGINSISGEQDGNASNELPA